MIPHPLWTVRVLACALSCTAQSAAVENDGDARRILVCVAESAYPALHQAAAALVTDVAQVPLLRALLATQAAGVAVTQDSAQLLGDKAWRRASLAHLVVIGLPGHGALLDKTWRFAIRLKTAGKTVHMLGYGDLQGVLGVVESERNPFLHSQRIDSNPFDTCIVKISGTSVAGVLAAVQTFRAGMLNGVVPAGAVTRPRTSLLDLGPAMAPPPMQPDALGTLRYGGRTQCAAEEYRSFIDAAKVEPRHVWRLRYLAPHGWDHIGAAGWLASPHRLAFGEAVTVAEFPDAAAATRVAAAIGAPGMPVVIAAHPAFRSAAAAARDEAIEPSVAPTVLVLAAGPLVLLSTLDAGQTAAVRSAIAP